MRQSFIIVCNRSLCTEWNLQFNLYPSNVLHYIISHQGTVAGVELTVDIAQSIGYQSGVHCTGILESPLNSH